MMRTVLEEWVSANQSSIEQAGFAVGPIDAKHSKSGSSVNLDSEEHIGTLTVWDSGKVEFQFNMVSTGDVIIDEYEVSSVDELQAAWSQVRERLMS